MKTVKTIFEGKVLSVQNDMVDIEIYADYRTYSQLFATGQHISDYKDNLVLIVDSIEKSKGNVLLRCITHTKLESNNIVLDTEFTYDMVVSESGLLEPKLNLVDIKLI